MDPSYGGIGTAEDTTSMSAQGGHEEGDEIFRILLMEGETAVDEETADHLDQLGAWGDVMKCLPSRMEESEEVAGGGGGMSMSIYMMTRGGGVGVCCGCRWR